MTDRFEVVVAACQDRERARSDFDELVRRIGSGAVRSEGVIVVDKDEAGIGDSLKPGMAAVIAIIDPADRLAAEQALDQSALESVAPMEGAGLTGSKDALAEAGGTFNPDRTVLPISDRPVGGVMGRTITDSVADWSIVMTPQAPENDPNVLVVLIDEAGFGQPDTFGRPIATPNFTRVQQMGVTYNAFHVIALCSPPLQRQAGHPCEPSAFRKRQMSPSDLTTRGK